MKRSGSSKLVTIICVLLAGGAAFGGHWYWENNPEFANVVREKIGLEPVEIEGEEEEEETSEQLIETMSNAETRLAQLNPKDDQKIEDTVRLLTTNLTKIIKQSRIDESVDQRDEAMRIAHRGLYLATELNNKKFGGTFKKVNRKLAAQPPTDDDEAIAKILGYCHEQSFEKAFNNKEQQRLSELLASLPEERHQTTLLCLVANRLVANGNKDTAKSLLEGGIKIVKNRDQRTRLVTTLMSLNLRVGLPPTVTQAEYDLMVESTKRRVASAQAQCRSKFG